MAAKGDEKITPPHYPIIYVRGYAFTMNEVEDTVSDPYMGFNIGSTKLRTLWTGESERYYFESPLVRMMKDFKYRDVYSAGLDYAALDPMPGKMSPKSIVIYRYYDRVSKSFGQGKQIGMEEFGTGLGELIEKVRDRVCGDDLEEREKFKVYLVGHSMGGLVIRCFLQNDAIGKPEIKKLVDKVFTYASPHNGIDFGLVGNIPGFLSLNSMNNFNRDTMRKYLGLAEPQGESSAPEYGEVKSLDHKFSPDRFFCLVGTNYRDYLVAHGLSSTAAGEFSDGLVRMDNAIVYGPAKEGSKKTIAPRAYVHRSHSGYFGIVNSEEGYQNLTRFLFGGIRVDGELAINDITLPKELEAARKDGRKVRASYHFECIARVRGVHWDLSRRVALENSAVFRTYAEMFPDKSRPGEPIRPDHERPELFTAYLDKQFKVEPDRRSLGFTVELGVLVPDYVLDGIAFLKDHFPGGYIYRDKINLETTPPANGGFNWKLKYGYDRETPNEVKYDAPMIASPGSIKFEIPIKQNARPGIDAKLILTARWWS